MESKLIWKDPVNGYNAYFTEDSYKSLVKEESFENKLMSRINCLKLAKGDKTLQETGKGSVAVPADPVVEAEDQVEEDFHLPSNADLSTFKKSGLQKKSSLSKIEQRKYIDLLLKFRCHPPGPNQSNTEKQDLAYFQALHVRVVTEQNEFLNNLKEVSSNQGIYSFLSPAGRRYTQEKHEEKLKHIELLPRYFININQPIPLSIPVSDNPPTLVFVTTIAELGSSPKVSLPTLTNNDKKTLPMNYDRIAEQYPTIIQQHIDGKYNKEVCSKDSNCENIACKTFSHIVVCTSVLTCLVNNHAPDYRQTWEIPFTVKIHDVEYQGKTIKQKVLYFDKPLPPKQQTARDKNTLLHKYALRAFLAKSQRKNSYPIKDSKQILLPNPSDIKKSNLETVLNEDDPFDDAPIGDIETFGNTKTFTLNKNRFSLKDNKISKDVSKIKISSFTNDDDDLFGDTSIDDIETFGDIKTISFSQTVKGKRKSFATEKPLEKSQVLELNKDLFGSGSDTETKISDLTTCLKSADVKNVKSSENEVKISERKLGAKISTSGDISKSKENTSATKADSDVKKEQETKREESFSEISDLDMDVTVSNEGNVEADYVPSSSDESTLKSNNMQVEMDSKENHAVPEDLMMSGKNSETADLECENLKIDLSKSEITNKACKTSIDTCTLPNANPSGKSNTSKIMPEIHGINSTDSNSDSDANLVIDISEATLTIGKKRNFEEICSPNESMDESFICNPEPTKVVNLDKSDKNVPNRNTSAIFKQKWLLRPLSNCDIPTPKKGNKVRLRSGRVVGIDHSEDDRSSIGSQSDYDSVFTPSKKPRKMEEIFSPDNDNHSDAEEEFPVKVIPLDPQDYGQIVMLKKKSPIKVNSKSEGKHILRSHSINSESYDQNEPIEMNDTMEMLDAVEGNNMTGSSDDASTLVTRQRRRSPRLRTTSEITKSTDTKSCDKTKKLKPKTVKSGDTGNIQTEESPEVTKRKRGRPRKHTTTTKVQETSSISAESCVKSTDDQISSANSAKNNGANMAKVRRSLSLEKESKDTTTVTQEQNLSNEKMRYKSVNLESEKQSEVKETYLDKTTGKSKERKSLVEKVTEKCKERLPYVAEGTGDEITKIKISAVDNETTRQHQETKNVLKVSKVRKKVNEVNPLDNILGKSNNNINNTETKPSENPSGLKEPVEGQVAYHLWKFSSLSMVIRTSTHGLIRDARQTYQGHIVPKLEYQLKHGLEQVSLEEASKAWISCYVKPFSRLIRGRIAACTSELIMLENLDLNQILLQANNFNANGALCSLHNIFMNLYSLSEGSYLLSHDAGDSQCHVKQPTEHNKRCAYDLHFSHQGHSEVIHKKCQWYPIDTNIILPQHRIQGRIPATYEPEDVNIGNVNVSKKRGGKKKKWKPRNK